MSVRLIQRNPQKVAAAVWWHPNQSQKKITSKCTTINFYRSFFDVIFITLYGCVHFYAKIIIIPVPRVPKYTCLDLCVSSFVVVKKQKYTMIIFLSPFVKKKKRKYNCHNVIQLDSHRDVT